jgi:hypothetical protein
MTYKSTEKVEAELWLFNNFFKNARANGERRG